MDYNSQKYQEYLKRKRLERANRGVSPGLEPASAAHEHDPEPAPEPIVTAPPVVMPPLHKIKDAGGSGA